MNVRIYQVVKKIYWSLPISANNKKSFLNKARGLLLLVKRAITKRDLYLFSRKDNIESTYINYVLSLPKKIDINYTTITDNIYIRAPNDPKVIAYYLPQFHPTPENDRWWGKGITEWNNVARAVPQYLGHYQPRLPGELGFYDLRIIDNMARQIELAKNYGIFGFSFYFYWFDGKRLLDKPLDMFIENKNLDFPFCLCWANESWTRRFDGTCGEILMQQSATVESYNRFIDSVIPYMRDSRYIKVLGNPVLTIYRPSLMPECKKVIEHWRTRCQEEGIGEIYIIGVKENNQGLDLLDLGFNAQSEFHPGTLFKYCHNITHELDFVQKDFGGMVMDYADIVNNQKYFHYNYKKLYRAAMPMWDNTARRDNKGMIFEGSTPDLYKRWLTDIFTELKERDDLEEPLVFINAWNEWGEGAYLEPDKRFGYAYLDATKSAIEESR